MLNVFFRAVVCISEEHFCSSEINQISLEKILRESCRIKKESDAKLKLPFYYVFLPFIYGNVFANGDKSSPLKDKNINFSFLSFLLS